ncbi:MAG: hypothetical protein ACR2PL_27740 [Dehalococcoidia bacterium]
MQVYDLRSSRQALDVIVSAEADKGTVELDTRNNDNVRVGGQYTTTWGDGTVTIMRVIGFKSAEQYSNIVARAAEAQREGVIGEPSTYAARRAYQTKLAILQIEGELLTDGTRRIGAARTPDLLLSVEPISDEVVEKFVTTSSGNLLLGKLRSGYRLLPRAARICQNYAGERMVILGMPGGGKSQLIRSLLSQVMAGDEIFGTESTLTGGEDDEA